jgi:hypothetical protein
MDSTVCQLINYPIQTTDVSNISHCNSIGIKTDIIYEKKINRENFFITKKFLILLNNKFAGLWLKYITVDLIFGRYKKGGILLRNKNLSLYLNG